MLHFAHPLSRLTLRKLGVGALLAALTVGPTACSKEEADYGSVRIKFRVGPGVDADELFEQTKSIRIIAPYNSCVRKWYEGEGADQTFVVPAGEAIMEEWQKRICAASDSSDTGRAAKDFLECDSDNVVMTQNLDADQPHLELRITIDSRDQARELSERDIRVGPLPTAKLTGCKTAFLFNSNGISGLNKSRKPVWKAVSEDAGTESPTPESARAYTVTVGSPDGQ